MIGSKLQEQLAHKLQIITEAYLQLPVTLESLLLHGANPTSVAIDISSRHSSAPDMHSPTTPQRYCCNNYCIFNVLWMLFVPCIDFNE